MIRISPKDYARLLYEIIIDKDQSEIPAEVTRFIILLEKNHHLSYLKQIIVLFDCYFQEQQGELEAEVTTVKPLTEEEKRNLALVLSRITNRKMIIKESLDPSLLGGVKVRAGDRLIDGSVQGRLSELKNKMTAI
ncbi:ATP synthase F1 subunit delta [Patescibacteria group bacterium]|nr:ATP synthase F1 subunit delta [Patescibacteria group bacterium]